MTALDRRLRLAEVLEVTGLSRTKLYLLRREGRFPAPLYVLGERTHQRWRESDIAAWREQNEKTVPDAPVRAPRRKKAAAELDPAAPVN